MADSSESFGLHRSKERFLEELFPVLDICNSQQAFSVGLVCALAAVQGGYPPQDAMFLAAAQDPRLLTALVERKNKGRPG